MKRRIPVFILISVLLTLVAISCASADEVKFNTCENCSEVADITRDNELNPKNYTMTIRNPTTIINSITGNIPTGGTDMTENESVHLNTTPDTNYSLNLAMNGIFGDTGTIKVAVEQDSAISDSSGGANEVVNQLNDDTYFDFTATKVDGSNIDTSSELSNYDVVIVGGTGNHNDDHASFQTALKNWVYNGGAVVSTGWIVDSTSSGQDMDYVIPVNAGASYGFVKGGTVTITDSSHFVTTGVNSFTVSSYVEHSNGGADPGTSTLGTWVNDPVVVVGTYGQGRIVYLGPIYMASDSYDTADLRSSNADRLLEQAVAWASDYTSYQYTFTNCGQTGYTGPTQAQANTAYSGTSLEGLVTVSSGIQSWTVPSTGTYTIEAYGAAGTDTDNNVCGYGARMKGDFYLTAGDVIKVMAGQMPSAGSHDGAGGGGSFVTKAPHSTQSSILVIAGGGGGTTYSGHISNADGLIGTSGGNSQTGCAGGTNGNGAGPCGHTGSKSCAGQGAGFFTDAGVTDCGAIDASEVAKAYVNGGRGGEGSCENTPWQAVPKPPTVVKYL